jgi:hypothetical protein
MKTYAEVYAKNEEAKMTNYSQDEDDRMRDRIRDRQERADKTNVFAKERNRMQSVEIGKDEVPYNAVDIEISDDDLIKVALQAHERDITINKMVGIILKDGLRSTGHIFEHDNKPQLLNEVGSPFINEDR